MFYSNVLGTGRFRSSEATSRAILGIHKKVTMTINQEVIKHVKIYVYLATSLWKATENLSKNNWCPVESLGGLSKLMTMIFEVTFREPQAIIIRLAPLQASGYRLVVNAFVRQWRRC